MKNASGAVIGIGVLSLVIGLISRLMKQPIAGVESHAIVEFAQACFLLAIALGLCSACQNKS